MGKLDQGVQSNFLQAPLTDYVQRAGLGIILRPVRLCNSVYSLALSGHLADIRHDYQDLNAPLLLLSGDSDQTVSAQLHSERLYGENPNTGLVIWRGALYGATHTRRRNRLNCRRLADAKL